MEGAPANDAQPRAESLGGGRARLHVGGLAYELALDDQASWLDAWAAIARDHGTRLPLNRAGQPPPPSDDRLRPVLTASPSPRIPYGFGDPCVVRDGGRWWMTATSNDAPDAFPLLVSEDLEQWRLEGFVFPEGSAPAWTLTGENRADFWAPELHRVGDGWKLAFTARRHDGELAIGLASAPHPTGPWTAPPEPLICGDVIDGHLLDTGDGLFLVWKEDTNGHWPRALAALLAEDPGLADRLFDAEPDRRTARLAAALWPWGETLEPMQQFFLLQPLIEAAADDYARARERLEPWPDVHAAMTTRVFAQPIAEDGLSLVGERRVLLTNDRPWEAHIIEGPWITRQAGRWWAFYAGNDFSTHRYGIGAAVAEDPLGAYRKPDAPLLSTTSEWVGPGHPSVAEGPDGRPWLFLHAYRPGEARYKGFRAVLAAALVFEGDTVRLERP